MELSQKPPSINMNPHKNEPTFDTLKEIEKKVKKCITLVNTPPYNQNERSKIIKILEETVDICNGIVNNGFMA